MFISILSLRQSCSVRSVGNMLCILIAFETAIRYECYTSALTTCWFYALRHRTFACQYHYTEDETNIPLIKAKILELDLAIKEKIGDSVRDDDVE